MNRRYSSGFVMILTVMFSLLTVLSAQTGTIRGTVKDANSDDALPGANIVVEGLSIGSASNMEGEYILRSVPEGTQTLTASYIGYQDKQVQVTVEEGEITQVNIELQRKSVSGEEIEITAQARGQTEAINQQISSNTVKNIVSSSKINELPDASAAEALSRLPGVSLMHGDKVVIRGVQAKQNKVLLNGVELPSTDMNTRSTNLGFISSNMLSGISVTKALTPDMDANAIGGTVNLQLKQAEPGFHTDVFLQGGYNMQDRTYDNYKVWASISNRFFDDKLGVILQGNASRSNGGLDQASASFEIGEAQPYGEAPYMMDQLTLSDDVNINEEGGGSLILDYKLPNGKIILQNTYTGEMNDNTTHQNRYTLDNAQGQYRIERDKFGKSLMINALQIEYDVGDLNTVFSASRSASEQWTDIRYGNSSFMNFYNDDPHAFGYEDDGTVRTFPNERRHFTLYDALDIPKNQDDAKTAAVQGWVVASDRAFTQELYNYNLDFTLPLNITEDISSEFKFGGKLKKSSRTNDVTGYYNGSYDEDYYNNTSNFFPDHQNLSPQNPVLFQDLWNPDYTRGDYFMEGNYGMKYVFDRDLMDRYMRQSMKGWAQKIHKTNSNIDDFSGDETFSAGYLMGTFNIGSKLTLIGGFRYEQYNMDYESEFVYTTHSVYGDAKIYDTLNTVDRTDKNLFPNIHLKYNITENSDIKLAYTQGISRPDYTAIMPNIHYTAGSGGEAGNPDLEPSISDNYDITWSLHGDRIGLFTLGGFYKKMENVMLNPGIYHANIDRFDTRFPDNEVFESLGAEPPTRSETINTFINNPNPAFVRGLETSWQTNFWYLPQPFNNMVFNVNYTRTWSDMDYKQIRNIDSSWTDPNNPRKLKHKYISKDTVRNARLEQQGAHNLNIILGADYKGFSGRISFNMKSDVAQSIGARPEEDQFSGDSYTWDVTLKQQLPVEGLSLSLNGKNIFHNKGTGYRKFRRELGGEIKRNLTSITYAPTLYQLNLRYNL